MRKRALITGITGQDGAYLAELLVGKGYEVHGIKRRASSFNTDRIDHLYQDPHERDVQMSLHYGDLTDATNLIRIIQQVRPDEIYNLAAQSHVAVSFETPEYTANADALGTLRILEAIRILGLEDKTRFYQASTSEMFGKAREIPQRETTPFYPRSPYGAAKVYAHWITVNYREAYGMFACSGILFNHECVALDTPLIVRTPAGVDIVTAGDLTALRRNGPDVQHFGRPDVEVWDGRGWSAVLGVTATRRRKGDPDHTMLLVQGRGGATVCTAHHTLIGAEGREDRADAFLEGERVMLASAMPRAPGWTALTEEMAELLGLLSADGHVMGKDPEKDEFQFIHRNPDRHERVVELWSRLFLGTARRTEAFPAAGLRTVLPAEGAGSGVARWLRALLYTSGGQSRVPALVLNGTPTIQAGFLRGFGSGGGGVKEMADSVQASASSALLIQGLYWLHANQGRLASVYSEQRDGRILYVLSVGDDAGDPRADVIRSIGAAPPGDHEWVVDLATETGRFMAGVGRMVVHNSPIRGETFVTRKITRGLARIHEGLETCLYLGNLDSLRDWGHARDYVRAQWLMLQQPEPEDFVIATGEQHSVREFVSLAGGCLGMSLDWRGSGVDEQGVDTKTGRTVVKVDPRYFRPTEVDTLLGDASKARTKLGWQPEIGFETLVREMVAADLDLARRDAVIAREGFKTYRYRE